MSGECLDCHSPICFCDDIKRQDVGDWSAPINWANYPIIKPEHAVIREPWQAKIERLEKEIKALRLILISHGSLIEENAKLRKMVIALDNGISITSDGLTYKNGEFFNEHSND